MKPPKKKYSLLAPESVGGYTAESGFQYQASLLAVKVPTWLSKDGFTEAIRESLGDGEAKFYIPSTGLSSEFFEYKNHRLTPSEFWPEIDHFQTLNATGAYHKFILVCTGVSDDLVTMINALNRLRNTYPFYTNAQSIQNESFNDFSSIVFRLGRSNEIAEFLFSKVWFEIDVIDAETHQEALFRESLLLAFPIFDELPAKDGSVAYKNTVSLLRSKKGKPVLKKEFEQAIWSHINPQYHPMAKIRFLTRSDLGNYEADGSIIFNWENFSGGSMRQFPIQSEWNKVLLQQLEETKKWLLASSQIRKIDINGYRRISASIALGTVFSSTSGFVISVQTKDGVWASNNYPTSSTPGYSWDQNFYNGEKNELAIGIGISIDIESEVNAYLKSLNFEGSRLYVIGKAPLISDQQTNLAVNRIKEIILHKIRENNIRKINLFLAGPSQFALFLGHRLNATSSIQCYERQAPNIYVPTVYINT